jgi:DNA polymerase I-like protein with 3'-5' exonuclease and polymerase domains
MNELKDQELEYLSKLLAKRHDELLHELHHAVTREYKVGLRQEIELTEQLQVKLRPVAVA